MSSRKVVFTVIDLASKLCFYDKNVVLVVGTCMLPTHLKIIKT